MAGVSKEYVKNLLSSVLKKAKEDKKLGESNPTGTIISFMGTTAPDGYLLCDGTTYNISQYSDFASYLKTQFGSVNYFGGDGTTTFAVPDMTNKFLKGSTTAGVSEDAGLPNITGGYNTGDRRTWVEDTYGAFFIDTVANGKWGGTSSYSGNTQGVGFDASKSDSIYGNSDTVTPANISVLYCIKY